MGLQMGIWWVLWCCIVGIPKMRKEMCSKVALSTEFDWWWSSLEDDYDDTARGEVTQTECREEELLIQEVGYAEVQVHHRLPFNSFPRTKCSNEKSADWCSRPDCWCWCSIHFPNCFDKWCPFEYSIFCTAGFVLKLKAFEKSPTGSLSHCLEVTVDLSVWRRTTVTEVFYRR